jgi:hypothetical protein
MDNLIRNFDFFGTTFQFTTFKHRKFRTVGGGLYSITCGIIMITFCFLFGRDLFYKKNAKIISQITIPDNYSDLFILTPENFVLAWRLSDDYSKSVNFSHIIYPSIKYFRQIFNSSGQFLLEETSLEITKCSRENSKVSEFYKKYDIEDWFCLDFNKYKNLTLGGFWDGTFVNYLQISLFACKNESPFFNNVTCTDFENLNSFLMKNNSIYIDFLFPEFYFDADDQDNPFKISYKSYYYQLDLNVRKTDRLFLKKGHLKDDQGWILNSLKEMTIYGFAEINDEIYFNDPKNFGKENLSSKLYEIILYTQKKFDYYQRSYMKIQDLSALIGGFMKFLLIFDKFFSLLFNNLIRDSLIYNEIFDFSSETENLETTSFKKISKFNTNKTQTQPLINLTKLDNIQNLENIDKFEKINFNKKFSNNHLKLANRNYLNSSSMELKQVNTAPDKNSLPKNLSTKFSLISVNQKINKKLNFSQLRISKYKIEQPKKNQLNFGLWFSITRTYCNKFPIFTKSKKDKIFLLARNYLNSRLDIINYLKTLEIIDKMKSIFFNHYQNLCFEFMKTPNLKYEAEYQGLYCDLNKKNESNFNGLIDYFCQKYQKNELSDVDKKLLDIVSPQIKKLSLNL